MTALRWLWARRRQGPILALVVSALACIQWEPTPIGVVIVAVAPVVAAMALASVDGIALAIRERRYERNLVRSIGTHPAVIRKGPNA